MSEGEEFICEFLESEGIEYRHEEIIEKLKNDTKNHRVADFYLPKYKVYIEYFGQWNVESQKDRYREKRQCYIDNKVPCIIFYPENLGIIDYLFYKRLVYVLNRYKMEKEHRSFRFDQFKKHRGGNVSTLLIGGGILSWLAWPWGNPDNRALVVVALIVIGYQLYLLGKSALRISKGEAPIEKNYFDPD
jgi:hypothetical protein